MGRTADAVAEGVAIATSAVRLTVKNQILVGTIARGGTFELEHYRDVARTALLAMAQESDQAAESLDMLRKRAKGRHSDPHGTHDYRDRDVRNLRRRAKQSIGVANQLRKMTEELPALDALVEEARAAAWADVRGNLDRRLQVEGMRPDQDPEYHTMREARMQALKLVDLQALSSQQRSRLKREKAAEKVAEKEAIRNEKEARRSAHRANR